MGTTVFSMETELTIDVGGGAAHVFDVWVDYTYIPAFTPRAPRGEYRPIDPPEPAEVEVIAAQWRTSGVGQYAECPGWLTAMLSDDEELITTLINDAESSGQPDPDYLYEMRRDEPDEAQEWRDYDQDC